MSIIQKFVDYTQTLDATRLAEVEAELFCIMEAGPEGWELSPEQEAEDIRRALDPNPKFATDEDIKKIFGKTFPS